MPITNPPKAHPPAKTLRRVPRLVWLLLVAVGVAAAGCGPEGGALLYFFGDVGKKEKIDAAYKLSTGPILVLVDDFGERLTWPETRDLLAVQVGEELLRHEATEKVISNDAVRRHRQAGSDFGKKSCREVGEMVGADQVVWLEVADFFASEQPQDSTSAARIAVTVKVINPNGTKAEGTVRLWPEEREGRPVKAELSSNEASRFNSRREIAKALTGKLATEVARLFYDHTLQDLATP